MKKFASVLLAVLVVFSMFSFVVSAANPTLTVSASKTADIKAGDEVTVTVKLSENSELGALTAIVHYDASAFEAVKNSATSDIDAVVNANFKSGEALATFAVATGLNKAGTLISFKLKALKAADSEIYVTIDEAVDKDDNVVEVAANKVTLKGYVEAPSEQPTEKPTEQPTEKPTEQPTEKPTDPTEPEDPCKDGHDYSNPMVVSKATCKKAGVSQKTCKVCGDKVEEAIPATGKCEPGAWKVVKAATTTAEGEKVQECKYCGEVLQRAKIAKLPSDPVTNPAIPNTDAQA